MPFAGITVGSEPEVFWAHALYTLFDGTAHIEHRDGHAVMLHPLAASVEALRILLTEDIFERLCRPCEFRPGRPPQTEEKANSKPEESVSALAKPTEHAKALSDGPFEPFGFRWRGIEYESVSGERRFYDLLLVMWPHFRVRGSLHIDSVNSEFEKSGGKAKERKTLGNYARGLSAILTERIKPPFLSNSMNTTCDGKTSPTLWQCRDAGLVPKKGLK